MSGGALNNQGIPKPTRFPGGTTNVISQATFGGYPWDDMLKSHWTHQDFDAFTAANYILTKTGAGTNALTAGDGGLLLLTTTTGGTDAIEMQLPVASFSFTAGKRLAFKAIMAADSATLSTLYIGLQNTNTDVTAATDGAYFVKPAGAAVINFATVSGSTTTTQSAVGTLVAATQTSFGFLYDGKTDIKIFLNDVQVGTQIVGTGGSALPTGNLNLTISIANSTTAARTLTIDGYEILKERFV